MIIAIICLIGRVNAAEYDELTNDCKGQLLFVTLTGVPVQFVSLSESDSKWQCINLRNGTMQSYDPRKLEVLPLYAEDDDFNIVSFAAGYAMPNSQNFAEHEKYLRVYCSLLKYRGSKRGDKLRKCLESVDLTYRAIQSELAQVTSNRKSAWDSIIDILENDEAGKVIKDAANDGDFQIAFACYCRLRINVMTLIETRVPAVYVKDSRTLLNDLGTEIINAYSNNRDNCNVRVAQFKKSLPDAYGLWEQGTPTNAAGIIQFSQAAFENFQRTLDHSEYTEFAQWGTAMLSVLQLFPVDGVIPKQAIHFDDCLKQYQSKYGQTK